VPCRSVVRVAPDTAPWFELYNLAKDPSQKKNIAKAHPEVFNRLKNELLKINASVMADGPDWHLK